MSGAAQTSHKQNGGSGDRAAAPVDRPVIFSAPMVHALLAGRKTQTRRILKPQPSLFEVGDGKLCDVGLHHVAGQPLPRVTTGMVITTQQVRFVAGDKLWVRENFRPVHSGDPSRGAKYKADVGRDDTKWKPSIHMPRWASRLTLLVASVKIERLKDITETDCLAEGVLALDGQFSGCFTVPGSKAAMSGTNAKDCFQRLWTEINGATAWEENPFVIAVSFEVIKANIDGVNPQHRTTPLLDERGANASPSNPRENHETRHHSGPDPRCDGDHSGTDRGAQDVLVKGSSTEPASGDQP